MRTPFTLSVTNPTGALPEFNIRRFDCPYFRNFYFVLKRGVNATVTIDCYDDVATAQARALDGLTTGRLMYKTGVALNESTVTMVADGAAAWAVGSMVIDWTLVGQWDVAVLAWTDSPESFLLERMKTVLTAYAQAHESLYLLGITDPVNQIILSHVRPGMVMASRPIIGLAVNTMDMDPYFDSRLVDIGPSTSVYTWVTARPKPSDGAKLSAQLAGTLRSILLDEQRTLSGACLTTATLLRGNGWKVAEEYSGPGADAEAFFWRSFMPLVHIIPNGVSALDTTALAAATSPFGGGKYRIDSI